MEINKSNSGLVIHVIITLIGVAVAFLIGLKAGGSSRGKVETQIGEIKEELKSDIQANTSDIEKNNKLAAANTDSLRKVNALFSNISRNISNMRPGPASTGKGMNYVDNVLGLKWVTRFSDGHKYCLIPYPLPWKHAQNFAEKLGGTLVVIDDEAENKWIVEKFGSSTEFWIGLTDERDEAKWLWVDDSDLLYKNWATGEPDNYKKMQHHAIMNKQTAKGAEEPGKWNDIPGNEVKIGIIEVSR